MKYSTETLAWLSIILVEDFDVITQSVETNGGNICPLTAYIQIPAA
jgi:hypothetical protein